MRTISKVIFAICLGLILGFAIVYWKAAIIVLIVTLLLCTLISDAKEFNKK